MDLLNAVVEYLTAHQLRLVTAESCTAGLITAELARVPGSGQVIESGLVVYTPEAKHRLLGVRFDTINQHGLTSEAVTREMAVGALAESQASVAVANTGVAGPDVPEDGTPVGTLCFAWAFRQAGQDCLFSETRYLTGDRNTLRLRAAHYALAQIPGYHALAFHYT